MNSFLDFIKNDIENKKTQISSLPTKTKTNKKKYNTIIEDIEEKYKSYSKNVKNYLLAKKKSIRIPEPTTSSEEIKKRVTDLEYIKFLLNPSNTYFEKMGFDSLLYEINNYYIFNFHSLNDIINGFLDKFETAGILLTNEDFDYTCYVQEYMSSFLEVRRSKSNSYAKVSEIFENIYWSNPELIEHIELNFRKLIRLNEKKFTNYITSLQKTVMEQNGITSYSHCLEQLGDAYIDLNIANIEDINDIVELFKAGTIEIEQYLEESKTRITAFQTLIPEKIDTTNEKDMTRICGTLEKFKNNLEEYDNYIEFKSFFDDFKNQYTELVKDTSKKDSKGLSNIVIEISKKEEELAKLNRKIFGNKLNLFEIKNDPDIKRLKAESVHKAKELYTLYKTYDSEYFKDKVLKVLDVSMSVADLLNLYYSFDYFKKLELQKVYNITEYDEIRRYSKNFDLFALNPRNIVTTGVSIFDETNIPRIIANKYRLNNIIIEEKDISPETCKSLLNKINIILRSYKIDQSFLSVEQIWFITKVDEIINEQ